MDKKGLLEQEIHCSHQCSAHIPTHYQKIPRVLIVSHRGCNGKKLNKKIRSVVSQWHILVSHPPPPPPLFASAPEAGCQMTDCTSI